ncbi:hypothetical protein T484DRAFT_3645627 [Baffinella frigidus]|nr:hypothetical protein T484DRAFT_3645627 [Cryptophyta sp. CCMP2293]
MSSFDNGNIALLKELSSFGRHDDDTTKKALSRVRLAVRMMPSTFRGQGSSFNQVAEILKPDEESPTTPPLSGVKAVTRRFMLFRRGSMKSIVNSAIQNHTLDHIKKATTQESTTADEEAPPPVEPDGAGKPTSPTTPPPEPSLGESPQRKGPTVPSGPLSPARAPLQEQLRNQPHHRVLDALFESYGKGARSAGKIFAFAEHASDPPRRASVATVYEIDESWLGLRSVVDYANHLPPIARFASRPAKLKLDTRPAKQDLHYTSSPSVGAKLKATRMHDKDFDDFQRRASLPPPAHLFHRAFARTSSAE